MFKAVIFDWDGTLADTKDVIVRLFRRVLSEVNCAVSDGFIERRIGIGTRRIFEEALRRHGVMLDDEELKRLIERKVDLQAKLTGTVDLFEGAVELLDTLHGKVRVGLATMSPRKVINKLLSEKSLKRYFDAVVTADDVLRPKPDPEIFLSLARMLNVRPECCLVVEDSIFGVRAARAAKMGCVAVASGAYAREELEEEGADLVVDSLKEGGEKILKLLFKEKGHKSMDKPEGTCMR